MTTMTTMTTVYEFAAECADTDDLLCPGSASSLWEDFVRNVHEIYKFSPWCYEAKTTTVDTQFVEYWRDQYEQALEAQGD